MIHIHCHIVPGVDDGAKSWEIALEDVPVSYQDGITHIVATPYADNTYSYHRGAGDLQRHEVGARMIFLVYER